MRLTRTTTSGMLWWKKTVTTVYEGSGTVWHNIETGRRPGTIIEADLEAMAWLQENSNALRK